MSVFCALSASATAGEIFHSAPFGPIAIGASTTVTLPKFDGAAGVLRSARLSISGNVGGTWSFENTSAQTVSVGGYASSHWIGALIPNSIPGGSMSAPNPGFVGDSTSLAPFDGTVDYGGSSGVSVSFSGQTGDGGPSHYVDLYTDFGIALYAGLGNFDVVLGPMILIGPGNLPAGVQNGSVVLVSGSVTVRYDFDVMPTQICRAAPWSGCPCNNPGAFQHGCANGATLQGGSLGASGTSSISADTLVLSAADMPDSSAFYIQGTAFEYAQTVYGDGLRCVAGSIVRLGSKANVGGASHFPATGDPAISVAGNVAAPGTRYYQVIYRDNSSYCTSSTFNATNGMAILWSP